MSLVWDKIEALAKHFEKEFNRTGDPVKGTLDNEYEWHNQICPPTEAAAALCSAKEKPWP